MKKEKSKQTDAKKKDKKELDMEQLNKVSGGTENLNVPPEKHKRIDIHGRG